MTTVAILGAGDLGGATAHALAAADRVSRVILVDAAAGVAAGKALDLQQMGAILGVHVQLSGTDDISRVTGCDVVVLADRFGSHGGGHSEWRDDDGLGLLRMSATAIGRAPLVFAGIAQGGLIATAAGEAGIARGRLIGSAPEALAGAIRAIVAVEARCSPAEVSLAVYGDLPGHPVVAWSDASIGGAAVERVLSAAQLARIESRVGHLWPPGPYALGAAAARVVHGLVESSRQAVSVLTMLDGEFGARRRTGVVPALLAPAGIVHARTPVLTTRERVQLDSALRT